MRQRTPMMQAYAECVDTTNNEIIHQKGTYDEQYYRYDGKTYNAYNPEDHDNGGSVKSTKSQPIHILPRHQSRTLSEDVQAES